MWTFKGCFSTSPTHTMKRHCWAAVVFSLRKKGHLYPARWTSRRLWGGHFLGGKFGQLEGWANRPKNHWLSVPSWQEFFLRRLSWLVVFWWRFWSVGYIGGGGCSKHGWLRSTKVLNFRRHGRNLYGLQEFQSLKFVLKVGRWTRYFCAYRKIDMLIWYLFGWAPFFPTFYTQFLLKHGRTCCKTFKYQIRISVMVMWEDWNLDEEAWILEPGWVGCGDLFESQRIARSFILRLSINHGGKPQPEKLQSVFWLLSRLVGLLLLVLHLFMSYYSNLFFQYTSLHQTMPHESGSFIFKPLEPGSCFQPEEQPIELNGDGLLGGFLLAGSKP